MVSSIIWNVVMQIRALTNKVDIFFFSDDDPFTFCCGEKAFACAQFTGNDKKDRLLVATDNNAVHGFFFPGGERDGIAMRFTAPPTAIKINSKVWN